LTETGLTRPGAARLLLWLLGGWLFLAGLTGYMAGKNFAILKPEKLDRTADFYGDIPAGEREMALRYAASELNRVYFSQSYTLQLLLSVAAVGLYLLSGARGRKTLAALAAMIVLSLILRCYVTPKIIEMGRVIDDVPREPLTPEREAFNDLHVVTVMVDMTKMALLAITSVAAARLLRGEDR